MHDAAHHFVRYVARCIVQPRKRVLEIGGRNVNGSIRYLFPYAQYISTDIAPGIGVDHVIDGGEDLSLWPSAITSKPFDTVITTETLEHTPRGPDICHNAHGLLEDGGILIITAAGDGRGAHSGIDGGPLREGEYYGNVSEKSLRDWLDYFLFVFVDTGADHDIYALAVK